MEQHVDPGRLIDRAGPIDAEHAGIADDAAHTRWTGERLDRPWAVAVLAQRRERARLDGGAAAEVGCWAD